MFVPVDLPVALENRGEHRLRLGVREYLDISRFRVRNESEISMA